MLYQYFVQYRSTRTGRSFEYVMYSELTLVSFKKWLVSNPLVASPSFELVKVAIIR